MGAEEENYLPRDKNKDRNETVRFAPRKYLYVLRNEVE